MTRLRNITQLGMATSPAGYGFSALLAGLGVAGSEPGQLGPVGRAEFRVSARKVHLDGIARYEKFPGDVGIAQTLAGKLDHLPLDRAQAGPPVRGARVLPPAPLGVGHGLLDRQPGAVLQGPVKTFVAQCSAGRGQVPLSSLP